MIDFNDAITRQTIALSGVFQAAELVKLTAWSGKREDDHYSALLRSVFKINASSIEDVYGEVAGLRTGIKVLRDQLGGGSDQRDADVARYTAQILALQRKLMKEEAALQNIAQRISDAEEQRENFGTQHANIIARLAEIYSENISGISPRIMVNGEPTHLNNSGTASIIRAVLLAGIRSAFLWRQSGGTRWKLLVNRKRYVLIADAALSSLDE